MEENNKVSKVYMHAQFKHLKILYMTKLKHQHKTMMLPFKVMYTLKLKFA